MNRAAQEREVDRAMAAGRRQLAAVRREVWPEHGGELPDEFSPDKLNEYVEQLEAALVGQASALSFTGSALGRL